MRLPQEDAERRLRRMVQPDAPPTLTDDEVKELLEEAKRTDRFDVWPTQDGWEPTWDLPAAAAEAWMVKAGKAAADVSFDADGSRIDASDVHEHCRRMASHYASQVRSHHREDEWIEWWPGHGGQGGIANA